MTSDLVRA